MNPALDVMRLEVAGAKVPLSLVSAEKNLVPLPEGHFLRRKVEDPAGARRRSRRRSRPRRCGCCSRASAGPLTVQEVKDHFAGIVPEERWTAFWTAARKNRQVLVSGSAKSAKVSWSESADAAEETRPAGVPQGRRPRRAWTSRASTRSARRSSRASSRRRSPRTRRRSRAGAARRSRGSSRRPRRGWRPTSPRRFRRRRSWPSADLAPRARARSATRSAREKALAGRAREPARLGRDLHRSDRRARRTRAC